MSQIILCPAVTKMDNGWDYSRQWPISWVIPSRIPIAIAIPVDIFQVGLIGLASSAKASVRSGFRRNRRLKFTCATVPVSLRSLSPKVDSGQQPG